MLESYLNDILRLEQLNPEEAALQEAYPNHELIWATMLYAVSVIEKQLAFVSNSEAAQLTELKTIIKSLHDNPWDAKNQCASLIQTLNLWCQQIVPNEKILQTQIHLVKTLSFLLKTLSVKFRTLRFPLNKLIPKQIFTEISLLDRCFEDKFQLLNPKHLRILN